MTTAIVPEADRRVAARQTPTLKPSVALVLENSPYRIEPWNARDAIAQLPADVRPCDLAGDSAAMASALIPCGDDRRRARLMRMGLAFGHDRDPNRAAAWLTETSRLLNDLPDDILEAAIDGAVKAADRGFMPAVGQIRAIADPLLAARKLQAARLAAMVAVNQPRGVPTPATAAGAGDDGPACLPADVARMNRLMRKWGCTTRYRPDGTDYQLAAGDADPADEAGTAA